MPMLTWETLCAKSIFGKFGWRESGCFKINADGIRKSILDSTQAFPTILELAQLSQHVYTISDLVKETVLPFKIEHIADWICIGTGHYSDGYCGAAYVNYKYSHVVIAHGGTEFKITKPMELYRDVIITDLGGVVFNKEVSQISSAYIFTKIIVNLCSDTQFSISVTGHSLGGWLAQISAFYIEHPNYISQNTEVKNIIEGKQSNLEIPGQCVEMNKSSHLHTVSFDSPGCRRALKKIVGYYGSKTVEWRENVDTLDFTVIIAPSNSVNTCGEHVGHALTLEMPGVKKISWGTASHAIQLFVDHLSESLKPKLREVHDAYYRKAVKSAGDAIILDHWYIGRKSSCQVNIFSPKELIFLTRAQAILKWRNNESLASSDRNIFEDQRHERARNILDDMKYLNDFILNFSVRHNVIEFPKNNLDENKLNMAELIWKLVRLFRQNRSWWNGSDESIRNVIRNLPKCREIVCESEESLYVEGIPKLHNCTTIDLCNMVRSFLESDQHFLSINASSNGKQCRSRLPMVHLIHCKKTFRKHVLFLNISSVQRLNREINMENIFSDTKYELIVVECDSKMSEINGVISGMIANAEKTNKKMIKVTSGENCLAIENVDLTLQFENLDDESKEFISHCHVTIHGNTLRLGVLGQPDTTCSQYLLNDLCSFFKSVSLASEIICDIYGGKIIDLSGGSLPVMPEHYIPRTLFQITLHVEKLKWNMTNFSDIIVVSNSHRSQVKEIFPGLDPLYENNLIHEPVGNYTKLDFLNVCESEYKSRNVHWFKLEKGKEESLLVWQMSTGQPCFEYLVTDEGGIMDLDLHALQNNFIILADEPGMGKSAAITKLFLEYINVQFNSTYSNSRINWPVYINLNNHQVELKNTTYSYDSAVNILAKAMNLNHGFEKSLFKYCLEEIGNVTIFIDSFDEISLKGQDFVVRMLEDIKCMTHSGLRVWIATRNYAKFELEQRLGTKSYQFHRVEDEAQIKFLVDSWTHNVLVLQRNNNTRIENFARIFARRAVREIQNVLGTDHTFIGIPLQLVFLALIYNDKFLELLEEKLRDGVDGITLSLSENDWERHSDKFSSTLELYNLFVDKKMNIWLEEKFKFDTRTDWMEVTLNSRMIKIHCQAAFLYVSSSILTDSNIKTVSLSSADSYEMNRVGFCEISDVSGSNFRFVHQTIAEYFTAKYLVNLIRRKHKNNVVLFLKTHYYKPYFKKIRYFLDSILCTDISVLKNLELLNGEIESLRQSFTNVIWSGVDALERNIFHYAMAYGNHDSGIFWMIAEGFSLFHKRDILGETCLSYFCLSEYFQNLYFPHLELERDLRRYDTLAPNWEDLITQITQVPVVYSIFCGTRVQNCLNELFRHSEEFRSKYMDRKRDIERDFNYRIFIDFASRHLLTRYVEINMTWLAHCTVNVNSRVHDFLSRLCLHNSLGENFEKRFLIDWFEACLGGKDGVGYELGVKLIRACLGTKELNEYALTLIRNNLPEYYNNAFPYLSPGDEISLWNSCSYAKDKRKMLTVMEKFNFYSLFRLRETRSILFSEVITFVYEEMNNDIFRVALNKGLVNAFHVFIFSKSPKMAFNIYRDSDEQARDRMIQGNFIFQSNGTTREEPELIVHSAQTFKDIIEGNEAKWTIKPMEEIKPEDFQSKFFTLPVKAEYPNTSNYQ